MKLFVYSTNRTTGLEQLRASYWTVFSHRSNVHVFFESGSQSCRFRQV